jgi:hypothetical protein
MRRSCLGSVDDTTGVTQTFRPVELTVSLGVTLNEVDFGNQ